MAKVAVIGCGTLGRAWAICLARAGHGVALWDPSEEACHAALEAIAAVLPPLEQLDLLGGANRYDILARMRPVETLDMALYGASYVQESVPEDLTVKRDTFSWLDGIASPDTILASSTAAYPPSSFTENLAGRERCLVAHPADPPYLLPLVELVPAPWTSPEVMGRAGDFLARAGQTPVALRGEPDGFVMGRLRAALLDEALRLIEDGHVGPEDLDTCLRDGLAPGWSVSGLFRSLDLEAEGGIRDFLPRAKQEDWRGSALQRVAEELDSAGPGEKDRGAHLAWRERVLAELMAARREALAPHKKDETGTG